MSDQLDPSADPVASRRQVLGEVHADAERALARAQAGGDPDSVKAAEAALAKALKALQAEYK